MRVGTSGPGVLVLVLVSILLSIGSAAHAQPSAASQASNAAGALFDKGRQYLAAGKYVEACAAFEHSQQLDPQLGTLFNLATCNAHLGKLATAWGEFHDIAQRDANKTRRAAAAREAARLAPRLPRLVIKRSMRANNRRVARILAISAKKSIRQLTRIAIRGAKLSMGKPRRSNSRIR